MAGFDEVCRQILNEIEKEKINNQKKLNRIKIKVINTLKYKEKIPTNADIAASATKKQLEKYRKLLSIKPIRTLSGVSVVAVMTKPIKCPHGKCLMCPGGPDSVFGKVPQSYTGKEPATRRAIRNGFDPYLQVFNRLEQYAATSHNCSKAELIIMGGTFPSFPKKYREEFVTSCFKAMNDFGDVFFDDKNILFDKFKRFFELPGDIGDKNRTKRIQDKIIKIKNKNKKSLEYEQNRNEKAVIRCVGLTIETRPDYGKLMHGNEMLRLGCTRIELGVQSVYEDALKRIQRGHSVKDSIESIRTLKDLGFKLNFHMMPGLPGVSFEKDLEGLKRLFKDEDFRPDMLKIYPCMVMKGTKLYGLWKEGRYIPLTTENAAKLILEFKKHIPVYCRVMRIQRDIPTFMTEAGVDITNLRQYIEKLKKIKCRCIKCRCIRCREAGIRLTKKNIKLNKLKTKILKYGASEGTEYFISAEDVKNDVLFGYVRLRFPSQFLRKEITPDSALIREIHVYSPEVDVGKKSSRSFQHKGIGKELMKTAEDIAKKNGKNKIVVISAIGTREYFRKIGYEKEGVYMVKTVG